MNVAKGFLGNKFDFLTFALFLNQCKNSDDNKKIVATVDTMCVNCQLCVQK